MLDNLDLYVEVLHILNKKPSTAQELLAQSTLAMDLNSVLSVLKEHIDEQRVTMKMGVYEITPLGANTLTPASKADVLQYQSIDTFSIPNTDISEKLEWTEVEDGCVIVTNNSGSITLNINEQEQLLELLKALN